MAEVGDKFGKLTLVEKRGYRQVGKTRKPFWWCRCDCGREREFQANNVICGNSKSCGTCVREGTSWNVRGEGLANARILYGNYAGGARRRGLVFNLTFEQFLQLTKQPCNYCGIMPAQVLEAKYNSGQKAGQPRCNGAYIYNGVDRLESMVGYVLENCVACCGTCNIAKKDRNSTEFLEWVGRVYRHHQGEKDG